MYTGRISGTSSIQGKAIVRLYREISEIHYYNYLHCKSSSIQEEQINPKLKIDRLSDVTTRSINRVRRRLVSKETTNLHRLQASER